ncbi:5552_t:CDS:2, partial [Dentiscutata heterogama]
MKRKRNTRSCNSCRAKKKGCSGGENGVSSCKLCRDKRIDCSYVKEIGLLGGYCENHPGAENANDNISYLQNIPNELLPNCNILYPQNGFIDSDGSSEYHGFGNLANSSHNTSQTNMPQAIETIGENLNSARLIKECLKHGSKIVHHLTDLVLLEHQYPQSLTSPTLNENLKNLLITLQSESSQIEKIATEQTNNLESSPLDQFS